MKVHFGLKQAARLSARSLALGLLAVGAVAQASEAQMAPAIARMATNLGAESPATPLSATVWLNLHNRAQLDAAVKAMYTPGSSSYHKWLTLEDLKQYAPTAVEVEAVKKELAAHNLTVVSSDKMNFSVKVKGQTADFERSFQTQINRYQLKNNILHMPSNVPSLTGTAGALVSRVTGFNNSLMKPARMRAVNPKTGKPLASMPVAGASAAALYSFNQCIFAPSTATLSITGSTVATGTFTGLTYGANASDTGAGSNGCSYSPTDLYKIYGLAPVLSAGYSGQGQTIVIVDAYGSPTIQSDAAEFNTLFNLPALTSANFAVYNPTPVTGADAGWAGETTLDVESSHSIAPGAAIAVVATASSNNDDLQGGIVYALTNNLGNVISNSYSEAESQDDPADMNTWNEICEVAASLGVSVNFATGDSGDLFLAEGYTDVPVPANAPYATGVGGTSVILSPIDGSVITTGWGTNITLLSDNTGALLFPPSLFNEPANASAFYGGAGGGISAFFDKPSFQSGLSGAGRHIPDVSALADPFTGFPEVFTDNGVQQIEVYGGTSLATPLFSGMWAIVNQVAGTPLGEAAPYMAAAAEANLLADVLPVAGPDNVTGSINVTASPYYATGVTDFTAQTISEPFYGREAFTSTLWNYGGGGYANLTFGTDTSLTVTQGWDDVTGYGTPDFSLLFK